MQITFPISHQPLSLAGMMPWSVGSRIPSRRSHIPSCCFAAIPEQLWDAQRVASLWVCPTPSPDVGGMKLCKPLGTPLVAFSTHPTLHPAIPFGRGHSLSPNICGAAAVCCFLGISKAFLSHFSWGRKECRGAEAVRDQRQ